MYIDTQTIPTQKQKYQFITYLIYRGYSGKYFARYMIIFLYPLPRQTCYYNIPYAQYLQELMQATKNFIIIKIAQ